MKKIFLACMIGFLSLGVAACEPTQTPFKVHRSQLPTVPYDIKKCFGSVVQIPKKEYYSSTELLQILAKVRASEVYKNKCGQRFERWYGDVVKNYGK